jgi:hypothetical protein
MIRPVSRLTPTLTPAVHDGLGAMAREVFEGIATILVRLAREAVEG